MNKAGLLKEVSQDLELPTSKVEKVVNSLLYLIQKKVASNEGIVFKKFGAFQIKFRKARKGRDFRNRRLLDIPEQAMVHFRPSKQLRVQTAGKFSGQRAKGAIPGIPKVLTQRFNLHDGGSHISGFDYHGFEGASNNRAKTAQIFGEEYLGAIGYQVTTKYDQKSEIWEYPIITVPKSNAMVRKPYHVANGVKGVCEGLLYEKLKTFFATVENGMLLPIKGKKFGYEPDAVHTDQGRNLYIDIEIDEPYDGSTRQPIHYHGCHDIDRNAYFNENGWVVVRFCEEQVFRQADSCCKKIAELVDVLTGSDLSTRFNGVPDLVPVRQWTYNEAQNMEKEGFRESYLGIEFRRSETPLGNVWESYGQSGLEITPVSFAVKKIAFDPLPELEEKAKALEGFFNRYIQFAYGGGPVMELVLVKGVRRERRQVFLHGYSLIENKDCVYDLRLIDDFAENTRPILFEASSYDEIPKLIDYAVENFFPISIVYGNTRGEVLSRTISELRYQFTADGEQKYYVHYSYHLYAIMQKVELAFVKEIVRGYCHMRKDARYFLITSIRSVKVLGTRYVDETVSGLIANLQNSKGWDCLLAGDLEGAWGLFRQALSNRPGELVFLGNFAHACLFRGEYEEAVEIYQQYKGQELKLLKGMLWEDMVRQDFDVFQSHGIHHENFARILDLIS